MDIGQSEGHSGHLPHSTAFPTFSQREDQPPVMSRNSFVFTPTALRSLEHDQDLLDRHEYKKQLASYQLSSYLLRKEARDRAPLRSGPGLRAAVCQDLVVQNAVYTGDLEAMQRLFPRGSTVNLIIEPHGGNMRWTTNGEGRKPACFSCFFCECACLSEALLFGHLSMFCSPSSLVQLQQEGFHKGA